MTEAVTHSTSEPTRRKAPIIKWILSGMALFAFVSAAFMLALAAEKRAAAQGRAIAQGAVARAQPVRDPLLLAQSGDEVPQLATVQRVTSVSRTDARAEREIQELVTKLKQISEEDQQTEFIQVIKHKLEAQFKRRHESQVGRLQKVREQVDEAARILEERLQQQDQIIERRLATLLGERDPLNWHYQPELPGQTSRLGLPRDASLMVESALSVPRSHAIQPTAGNRAEAPAAIQAQSFKRQFSRTPQLQTTRPNSQLSSPASRAVNLDDDIVSIGFHYRSAIRERSNAERQLANNAISRADFLVAAEKCEEAAVKWELKRKELERRLRVAEVELESIKTQVVSIERELHAKMEAKESALDERRQSVVAQKEIEIAQLEILTVTEQMQWAKSFQESSLEADSEQDEPLPTVRAEQLDPQKT